MPIIQDKKIIAKPYYNTKLMNGYISGIRNWPADSLNLQLVYSDKVEHSVAYLTSSQPTFATYAMTSQDAYYDKTTDTLYEYSKVLSGEQNLSDLIGKKVSNTGLNNGTYNITAANGLNVTLTTSNNTAFGGYLFVSNRGSAKWAWGNVDNTCEVLHIRLTNYPPDALGRITSAQTAFSMTTYNYSNSYLLQTMTAQQSPITTPSGNDTENIKLPKEIATTEFWVKQGVAPGIFQTLRYVIVPLNTYGSTTTSGTIGNTQPTLNQIRMILVADFGQ